MQWRKDEEMKNQKEDTENLRKIKKKNDDVDNGKNKKHSLQKKKQ